MSDRIHAPFTAAQVEALNRFQQEGTFHPFTCFNHHTLVATADGWRCPECPSYRQGWAHAFMAAGGAQGTAPAHSGGS